MDQNQTGAERAPTPAEARMADAWVKAFDTATLLPIAHELRRRIKLFRDAPRGDNPAKADALETFLWWVEGRMLPDQPTTIVERADALEAQAQATVKEYRVKEYDR